MKVLVTGGRDLSKNGKRELSEALDNIHLNHGITYIIHGGCPTGADAEAHAWARRNGVVEIAYHAKWRFGKAAGPARNELMVTKSFPTLAVVTPGGNGTANCRMHLEKNKVPIHETVTP